MIVQIRTFQNHGNFPVSVDGLDFRSYQDFVVGELEDLGLITFCNFAVSLKSSELGLIEIISRTNPLSNPEITRPYMPGRVSGMVSIIKI